ncbi:glycosyltransferase family 1 protein [Roseovarius sp. A46]|uniref:glycosyltransferase family 4 protein n=1 Tax=Roseovarius sp. A46 TaxID=2109331 RepID=UPI0013E976EF|nr:glycosyltransferase family 1 protein [Roseovarius sp. A46]
MTLARAHETIGADQVWLGHHDRITDSYKVYPYPTETMRGRDLTDYATLCEVLHVSPSLRRLPGLEKYAKRPVKRRWKVLLRDLNARLGNRKYFRQRDLSLEEWKAARTKPGSPREPAAIQKLDQVASPGDRLVLLDNAWQPKGLERWLQHAGTTLGLEIWPLLHDLIPLVTPQYVEDAICERFHEWLTHSTEYVTCYLANSESTGRDLRSFLKLQNASQPVKVVPLAQDIVSGVTQELRVPHAYSAFAEGMTVPEHVRSLTKTPYVLVVGTLEVRKNLWQLATVWDRLRRQSGRPLPKLVFAGRRGWLNNDFNALMEATGWLGGWAELVEAPNDTVLSYLYRNCLFTAKVSFYEGWGLPIGESLAYGKTAVVSNTSSMPEVGGDMVEYCDPHSLDDIEVACLRLIDDPDHRIELEARISRTHRRSWDEVTRDMLEALRSPQS